MIFGILKTDYSEIIIWSIVFSINVLAIFSKRLETIENQLFYSDIRNVEITNVDGSDIFGFNYIRVSFYARNHKKRFVKLINQKAILDDFIELMSDNKIQVVPSFIKIAT